MAINITTSDGKNVNISWSQGMNAQNALEEAYSTITFAVQYYGTALKYFVIMIDGTFQDPANSYYWLFYVNGQLANQGIDETILNDGDSISFKYQAFSKDEHAGTYFEKIHEFHQKQ